MIEFFHRSLLIEEARDFSLRLYSQPADLGLAETPREERHGVRRKIGGSKTMDENITLPLMPLERRIGARARFPRTKEFLIGK